MRERIVVIAVYDDVRLLDVTGPFEVLTVANENGASYRVEIASVDGRDVRTAGGMRIGADLALPDVGGSIDTLIVPGSPDWLKATADVALVSEVKRLAATSRRTAGICAGAFPLAAAGLLDGRRAATHWSLSAELCELYPQVAVDEDAIFVRDGRILTSAGVAAGIDLAVALVEEDCGADLARRVAKHLVVFMVRPGGQSQFSTRVQATPRRREVSNLLDAIVVEPAADHSLRALAARASISPRHLRRLFASELGRSPAAVVADIRLEAAKALLEGGDDALGSVARATGFGSPETLRRVFTRQLGVTPGTYRARFRGTSSNRDRATAPAADAEPGES
ncbi:GlxA family transcriptional regulator [Nocardioides panacihumi]|uniref:GlxA family transcriptional regulator n=1 Tax=Nocardioides panacihumi TaxID=400774 RepID=A0ABN2RUM9_9ACTN